jgi:uncharacterized protein
MNDLVTALGLVLVIEGLIWAAFPRGGVALLRLASESPDGSLRMSGAIAVAVGVGIVWLVRG